MPELRVPVGSWSLERSVEQFGWRGPAVRDEDGLRCYLAFAADGTGEPFAVRLHQEDDRLHIRSGAPLPFSVAYQVQRILGVAWPDDDAGFAAIGQRDPVVERLQARYPGVRPIGFRSLFEAAVEPIIGLLLPPSVAGAVRQRVAEALGDGVAMDHRLMYAFPPPDRLVDPSVLEGIRGLNGERPLVVRKRRRIAEVARACVEWALDGPTLRAWDGRLAVRHVAGIAQLGEFAAEAIVMLGAHHRDVLLSRSPPVTDPIERAYRLRPGDAAALEGISEVWAPYRSWVSALMFCQDMDAG